MGLNNFYTVVRLSILMMKPLPTVGEAYSPLIQTEKLREDGFNSHCFLDVVSLNVWDLSMK